jgi:3-oxoacyl-[acyl-carrier protein] reductase
MDLGLHGKVAVVMAASRGLARASALALAQEGCNLAICSRNPASINTTANMIRAATEKRVLARAVDVTQAASIIDFAKAVEAEYGAVDILLKNSGGPPPGTFDTLDESKFAYAAELLLLNNVRATKASLPLMRKTHRGGRILTITSVSVREVIANLMLSNSLRAAVTGWSKTLARELAPEKITVNCVAPGTIHTERIDELIAANAQKSGKPLDQVRNEMVAKIPSGRFGAPEEFAAAVAFLASEKASYISGTTLYVDGAMMASVV